jgi:hypothetical protein
VAALRLRVRAAVLPSIRAREMCGHLDAHSAGGGNMSHPPLRRILETMPGEPLVFTVPGVSAGDEMIVRLRTVVHTLECGHTTEPYVRDGCRIPPLPKRRRCQKCLESK